MSYEDDGDGDGDERGRGKLVPVASFYTAHEAELAKTKLTSEGILAFVWDAATINADPLLAVALRGVKVAVPERDAPRARAILGPEAEAFEGNPRPAFRVRGTRSATGVFLGALLGIGAAVLLGRAVGGPAPWIAGIAIIAVGYAWGERVRADSCSSCRHPVLAAGAPGADECPHCHLALRGTIDDINDRLAAEDALGESEDLEQGDDDLEVDRDDDDDDDHDERGHTTDREKP